MKVLSLLGRVHLAESRTKKQVYAGYVHRLCDGQWIRIRQLTSSEAKVTCPACKKRL